PIEKLRRTAPWTNPTYPAGQAAAPPAVVLPFDPLLLGHGHARRGNDPGEAAGCRARRQAAGRGGLCQEAGPQEARSNPPQRPSSAVARRYSPIRPSHKTAISAPQNLNISYLDATV
uniref:Uncharacterized protein n=1 Tax=Aegilops tauschii subsp. strangulata TaxID=200361 RepID=A0A453DUG2_AEGTS